MLQSASKPFDSASQFAEITFCGNKRLSSKNRKRPIVQQKTCAGSPLPLFIERRVRSAKLLSGAPKPFSAILADSSTRMTSIRSKSASFTGPGARRCQQGTV